MTARLVLLMTSPRVAPGLLTVDAWEVLRDAQVFAAEAGHGQAAAVAAVGGSIQVLAAADKRALARTLLATARSARPVEPVGESVASGEAALANQGPPRGEPGSAYRGEAIVWLGSPDGDPGLAEALASEVVNLAARGGAVPEIEVLTGSYDLPGARLLDLVAVMDRLRSPGGCPWDRKQDHRSLVTYLLEETYETLEAIERGDDADLREELGDLLLQVVFHARIAEERPVAPWTIDDVAAGIVEKLVGRHPHVFAGTDAPTAEHVEANWHVLKAAEKGRSSVTEGVPAALPALSLAVKLMSRAEKAGISVRVSQPNLEDDIGDLLLSVVALARTRGVDPEQALRDATRAYRDAVRQVEGTRGEV